MNIFGLRIAIADDRPARSLADDPAVVAAMERRSSAENPRYSLDDPNILSAIGGYGGALAPVSPQRALQTSAVFACIRVLSESLAQLPVSVFERNSAGARAVSQMPLSDVLAVESNSYQSGYVFRESGQAQCALYGNFYAEQLRNRMGEVVGLYPLNAWECVPRLDGLEKVLDVNGVTLRGDQFMHIPALGYDGIKGLSPIALHRASIGMSIAAEEFGAKFYENGTKLSGVLEHPGKLGPGAKKDMRESWSDIYAGKQNAGRVAVLEEGMKFSALSMPLEDAQYIESRKFQITDIARIFGVPPHKIGDLERATFSNIEQQSISFVVDTLLPWVKRWESEINRSCLPRGGRYFVKFNLAGLLRGDIASRYAAYKIGRDGGWLCADDIRELEDMNPLPDGKGKVYLEPLNMKPAGEPAPQNENTNGN
jgi:HK97 family phage portal protein